MTVNEIREWKDKQATWNRTDVTLNETRRMTQGLNSKGMKFQTSAKGFVLLRAVEEFVQSAESSCRTLQL